MEQERNSLKFLLFLVALAFILVIIGFAHAETYTIDLKLNGTNLTITGINSSQSYNVSSDFNGTFSFNMECMQVTNSTYDQMFQNLTICWQQYHACSKSEAQCQGFKMFWEDQQLYKENWTQCSSIDLPRCNDRNTDKQGVISNMQYDYLALNRSKDAVILEKKAAEDRIFPICGLIGAVMFALSWVIKGKKIKWESGKNRRGPEKALVTKVIR